MGFYLLDGRICPALPLDEFDNDGNPTRMVYAYKSTEGAGDVEWRVSNSVAFVPMGEDGSSWTIGTIPRGANIYTSAGDGVNLQTVLNHLVAAHARRDEVVAAEQGGATHGEPSTGVTEVFQTPATQLTQSTTGPLWQRLGFESKAAWKASGSPTG